MRKSAVKNNLSPSTHKNLNKLEIHGSLTLEIVAWPKMSSGHVGSSIHRGLYGASIFMHWLVGMVYVFYFASFVILLREVLRPGVLWFLRNLNDPDFNPIQEMIHLSLARYANGVLLSKADYSEFVTYKVICSFTSKLLLSKL